ncbi:MAG: hypothetical protein COV79_01395 [Parcubacteria group bacterium CG11_big_fil_rev_8_21_14_0_20_41_14]|nr:MAG: hypothetical protein COV79_01395 [Parcubacteria group bacterium CG11_big_fil_rev_8_21_14_0_20_41_14]
MINSIKSDSIISAILSNPIESRAIELKPSIPWRDINHQHQLQEIVKSIIGLSNVKDGGKIILGVIQNPDRTFAITGMSTIDLQTYDQDHIYQVVRAYANPALRFEIRSVEYRGKFFIVFAIQEFLYMPVICIKNGSRTGNEPLISGALYIRTHKPETKQVNNETEMREIINLAVDKELELLTPRIQKLIKPPFIKQKIKGISSKKFANELKDIKL